MRSPTHPKPRPPAAAPKRKAHTYQENQRPRRASSVTPIERTATRDASGGIAMIMPAQSHARSAQTSTRNRRKPVSCDLGFGEPVAAFSDVSVMGPYGVESNASQSGGG